MNPKIHRLCSLMALLMFAGLSQASVFVNPTPSFLILSISQITQTGDSVDVGIGISGLGAGGSPSLGAYDLDLRFDANQLAFTGAVFGDTLLGNQLDLFDFGANPRSAELSAAGTVNLFELSLDAAADLNALQADSFTLATVSFKVLNAGTGELTLIGNALSDADANPLSAVDMSVSITTVPLPSAIFPMAFGLLGLGVAGKARNPGVQ